MGRYLAPEQLAGACHPLNVIGVGVGGNQRFARREIEIHLPNQLDNIVHRIQVTDVNEEEFTAAVNEIDIDAQPAAGLIVHLNDVGEKVLPFEHGSTCIRAHYCTS
jgi:hypothetical protein